MADTDNRVWNVVEAAPKLRDLTDAEFLARYDCDRFTATVLSNRFRYIASHMATQLRTHAFSPIMRDTEDLCATLSGPPEAGFPMASVSQTLPLFNGSIPDAVRIALEEYGVDQLAPGDTILVNDYYRVGTHFNDACNIRPVFYEGRLIGAVTLRAHLLDIGGSAIGPMLHERRDIWQDGLRLPPILLYAAGKPVPSTFKLLYDNTRLGHLIAPDLKTIFHALELGERLLLDTIGKYGLDAYFGAVRYVCDVSAETIADALAALPDGVYEGEEWVDGDGLPDSPEYSIRVRITKVGDRAEFDLRGTSAATRTGLNCAWPDIKTGVALALKLLIDPKSPVTSGTLRNVDIVVPPDVICNPSPPRPCYGYFEPVMMICYAVFRALNPVLGADAIPASSLYITDNQRVEGPDGTDAYALFAFHTLCGPWGATKHGDADSGQQTHCQNLVMVGGVESFEIDRMNARLPAVALRTEYMPDTAGAGMHRGGAANVHDTLHFFAAHHAVQGNHTRRSLGGGGVHGGKSGPTEASWLWRLSDIGGVADASRLPATLDDPVYASSIPQIGRFDAATRQFDSDGDYVRVADHPRMEPGVIARIMTQGGGGWGDPLDRDPERVKIDVRDGYVTIAAAARDYGVVVIGDPDQDPEGLHVDEARTRRLRGELRGASA